LVQLASAQVPNAGPLSPYADRVNLEGRYLAAGPNTGVDGLALANTTSAVSEISGGVVSQQNTFTPFNSSQNLPIHKSVDLRGHQFQVDMDMSDPGVWAGSTTVEAGIGTTFSSTAVDGVVIEGAYTTVAGVKTPEFRLRTNTTTGPWVVSAYGYGTSAVYGTYTLRVAVASDGQHAELFVTPKEQLTPTPVTVYPDQTSTVACNITGATSFVAGFLSTGAQGSARGSAYIVRFVTDAGPSIVFNAMAVNPFITTPAINALESRNVLNNINTNLYAFIAPAVADVHLSMANVNASVLGTSYTGSAMSFSGGSFALWPANPVNPDPSTLVNQSYPNPAVYPAGWNFPAGPGFNPTYFMPLNVANWPGQQGLNSNNTTFQYDLSPLVYSIVLLDVSYNLGAGKMPTGNFSFQNGVPALLNPLNSPAEIGSIPVGPAVSNPAGFPGLGMVIGVALGGTDPVGDYCSVTEQNGQVSATTPDAAEAIVVDEVAPEADFTSALSGVTEAITHNGTPETIDILHGTISPPDAGWTALNATNGATTVFEGNVVTTFYAKDLGDGTATKGSGFSAYPETIIEQANSASGPWTTYASLLGNPWSDNNFQTTWGINQYTPCRYYRIRLWAVDRVGLVTSTTVTNPFYVQTLRSVTVNLTLDTPANNQRWIEFRFGSAPGTVLPAFPAGHVTAPTIIEKLVRFHGGVNVSPAPLTFFGGVDIPNCDSINNEAWAKDLQHTKASASPLRTPDSAINPGSEYTVNLTLFSGDLNDDNIVNFFDYAIFVSQYGLSIPPDTSNTQFLTPATATTLGTVPTHADMNGNGAVDFGDYVLLLTNYATIGAPLPGNYVQAFAVGGGLTGGVNIHDPKLKSMTVKQLVAAGIKEATKWDLNHDGIITTAVLDKVLQQKMAHK
jgi:hypothetical protein